MADLKPCPFCGGEAELKRVERTILGTEYFSIICTTCHCQTAGNQDVEKSITVWNARKPMEAEYMKNITDELLEAKRNCGEDSDCTQCVFGCEDRCRLQELQITGGNNGWIPCNERLPEEPKENPEFEGHLVELYLVSIKDEKYPFRAFWNGKEFTDGLMEVHPEAWMPLPEPWRGEPDAKEEQASPRP